MPIISGGKVIEGAVGRPHQNAGAPTSGASGTLKGLATVGQQLVDTTGGVLYICTASSAGSITWATVGSQM